jgi:hypothetical protein
MERRENQKSALDETNETRERICILLLGVDIDIN